MKQDTTKITINIRFADIFQYTWWTSVPVAHWSHSETRLPPRRLYRILIPSTKTINGGTKSWPIFGLN